MGEVLLGCFLEEEGMKGDGGEMVACLGSSHSSLQKEGGDHYQ